MTLLGRRNGASRTCALGTSGGSGKYSDEEARSSLLIGACDDSLRFVEKAHMLRDRKSDASMSIDQSGAELDTSHVTGHENTKSWCQAPPKNETTVE